jgi:Spy/CpxP family protein refolding chaperone
MKSAYELAMERLRAAEPDAGPPLTAAQKAQLAEIDRVYQGKIAAREIFLRKHLDEMLAASKWDEAEKIKKQLAGEKARLEEEKDAEKEKARRAFSNAPG